MGLISFTWIFCNNLVKILLVVIEILSFSGSVLLLEKADGDHLAVPNCKKKYIMAQCKDYCKTKLVQFHRKIVFQFYTLLFLVRNAILTCLFVFNLKKKLSAGIIMKQIWSKLIKRLLRYCHFHVLCFFSNGKRRPS